MAALPRVENFFLFSRRVLALKGAEVPPLREAAATLAVMRERQCEWVSRTAQLDNETKK